VALKNDQSSSVPTVTHLQSFFLRELSAGVSTGKTIREQLRRGWSRSRVGSYRMMRKLKETGLVTARVVTRLNRKKSCHTKSCKCRPGCAEPGLPVVQ
jgi:hypothetical protein